MHNDKMIKIFHGGKLIHEEPLDFITHNEMIHEDLKGEGFFDAIKKIFPVIGLATNLVGKVFKKKQPEPIEGGFLSSLLPLVLETVPGIISGFKDLFSGNGISMHGKDNHAIHYNNKMYMNPIKFTKEYLHELNKHVPMDKMHDYNIKLTEGGAIHYDENICLPLSTNKMHMLPAIINHIKEESGHGNGVGAGLEGNGVGAGLESSKIDPNIEVSNNNLAGFGIGKNIGLGSAAERLRIGKGNDFHSLDIYGGDFKSKAKYSSTLNNVGEL